MDLGTLSCLWRVGMWSGPRAEGAGGKLLVVETQLIWTSG